MSRAPGRAPGDDGGREHHLEVRRTARFHTLGPWDARGSAGSVWIVLHGYRQLARRFLRRFAGLQDGDARRLIVAPEALSRFYVEPAPGRHGPESLVGGTWMTREDRTHEIRDYVRYLDDLADLVLGPTEGGTRPHVTLLGFSQGLHTAARWAVSGRHRLDRLVLWGDYLPPDLDGAAAAERLTEPEIVVARGREDGGRREHLARAEADRWAGWGLSPRVEEHAGGHELDRGLLERLAAEEAAVRTSR